jgi:hypothetical protein
MAGQRKKEQIELNGKKKKRNFHAPVIPSSRRLRPRKNVWFTRSTSPLFMPRNSSEQIMSGGPPCHPP